MECKKFNPVENRVNYKGIIPCFVEDCIYYDELQVGNCKNGRRAMRLCKKNMEDKVKREIEKENKKSVKSKQPCEKRDCINWNNFYSTNCRNGQPDDCVPFLYLDNKINDGKRN